MAGWQAVLMNTQTGQDMSRSPQVFLSLLSMRPWRSEFCCLDASTDVD